MGWIKNKLMSLMISLSNTEKMIISDKDDDNNGINKHQSHKEGMLSDSLMKGELTQEVKELRWRLYKVIQHTKNYEFSGYDENGYAIATVKNSSGKLKKYKCDDSDDEFDLIMVVPNKNLTNDAVDVTSNLDDITNEVSRDNYLSNIKNINTILITREHIPRFKLEDYTTKLLVRKMDDEKLLLEFYISKYSGEDRKSRLFLSEIKKIIKGHNRSPVIDINKVFFITENCLGAIDNLEFEFEVIKFHRIIEYDGSYVIKFVTNGDIIGNNILEKYKMSDIDERYEKNMKK